METWVDKFEDLFLPSPTHPQDDLGFFLGQAKQIEMAK